MSFTHIATASASSLNSHIAILSVYKVIEHSREISKTAGGRLLDKSASQRQVDSRKRCQSESASSTSGTQVGLGEESIKL